MHQLPENNLSCHEFKYDRYPRVSGLVVRPSVGLLPRVSGRSGNPAAFAQRPAREHTPYYKLFNIHRGHWQVPPLWRMHYRRTTADRHDAARSRPKLGKRGVAGAPLALMRGDEVQKKKLILAVYPRI
jgi:hypothetical protein